MKVPFQPITIKDKEIITSFIFPSNYRNCDYSFANMCSWRFIYDSEYAVVDDFLLIRFWIEDKTRLAYMTPVGTGNLKYAVDLLEADSLEHGHPLCMLGVTPDAKEELEKAFPGGFFYIPERDYFEEDAEDLNDERRSLTYALTHFEELGLQGGGICIDHQIIAFTFGCPINHNTFDVNVEKADINYEGAYAVINKEFASRLPEKYIYINREEDLGIPGLRKAKLSYNPAILLEKNAVIKKPSLNK